MFDNSVHVQLQALIVEKNTTIYSPRNKQLELAVKSLTQTAQLNYNFSLIFILYVFINVHIRQGNMFINSEFVHTNFGTVKTNGVISVFSILGLLQLLTDWPTWILIYTYMLHIKNQPSLPMQANKKVIKFDIDPESIIF